MMLTRSDGLEFWVAGPGWSRKPDMECISMNMPRMDAVGNINCHSPRIIVYKDNTQVSEPSMNVSVNKTPDQIARSIVSRILAESEEIYSLAMDRARKTREFHAIKANGMDEMQGIVQGEKRGDTLYLYGPGESRLRMEVSTCNGNDFNINLDNLPKHKALQIASLLKSELF